MTRAALVLVATVVLAGPTGAAPVPDSSALSRLHVAAGELNRFRVVTGRTELPMSTLLVGPEGVVIRAGQRRPALVVTDGTPAPDTLRVAWPGIERIEGGRSSMLRGAAVGFLVGSVVGFGARAAFGNELHDASGVAILAIPLGGILGAGIGTLAGGTTGWRVLYPEPRSTR